MADLDNIMKEEKRNLIISLGFLLMMLIISLVFAKGIEGKTFLFHILEKIGGHNVALETNMFGIVALVIMYILYLLHKGFYERTHYLLQKYKILRYLLLIFFILVIILNLLAAPLQRLLLTMGEGLDTVVDRCRISKNYAALSTDEEGKPADFGHSIDLINYGSKNVSFHINFVDMNDPEKVYHIKNEDGSLTEVTLEPGEDFKMTYRISEIDPGYKSYPSNGRKRPRYNVVIYNEEESHTFITYN